MKELYCFCEGPTEQGFCKQVLRLHLFAQGDGMIHTIKVAHSKHHGVVSRGGIGKYAALRRDIANTLKSRGDAGVRFTTMIDLYGLRNDFPGKSAHVYDPQNPHSYAAALEQAFEADIGDVRFIAHLQLHEYETLLFADPDAFRISFDDCDSAVAAMHAIVSSVRGIEYIDDDEMTAPSKRIIDVLPAYEGRKVTAGPDIAEFIGLPNLRRRCPHFDGWIRRLEGAFGTQ